MRKALVALTTIAVVILAWAGVAWPHNAALGGGSTCVNGTYSVTWTITTTNVPAGDVATVTLVSATPASNTVSGLPHNMDGNTTYQFTSTGILGTSKSASVTVSLRWSDYGPISSTGSVVLAGTCVVATTTTTVPPTTTTTAPPTTTTTEPPTTTTIPVTPPTVPPVTPPTVPTTPSTPTVPVASIVPTPVPVTGMNAPLAMTGSPVAGEVIAGSALLLFGAALAIVAWRRVAA